MHEPHNETNYCSIVQSKKAVCANIKHSYFHLMSNFKSIHSRGKKLYGHIEDSEQQYLNSIFDEIWDFSIKLNCKTLGLYKDHIFLTPSKFLLENITLYK